MFKKRVALFGAVMLCVAVDASTPLLAQQSTAASCTKMKALDPDRDGTIDCKELGTAKGQALLRVIE
jgi:hypothetical protein